MVHQIIKKDSVNTARVPSIVGATLPLPKRSLDENVRVSQLTSTDAAYLAGLFDGEGCLALTLTSRKRRRDGSSVVTVGIVFTIVNTNRPVLDWCVQAIGKGLVVQVKSTQANPRNLPTFRYNLDCKDDIFNVVHQINPHLKIKAKQAEACLAYLRSRVGKRRGAAFTEEEVNLMFSLRLANQKSYNLGSTEHILYKKQPYNRAEFRNLLLEGRDGSIYHSVEWTSSMDALVGTSIDRVVARTLGLKLAQVQRRRDALGIPPFRGNSYGNGQG